MLSRRATAVALVMIGLAITVAFIVQLIILGALGFGPDIDQFELQPVVNVQPTQAGLSPPLRFDASRGPAVVQVRGLNLHAGQVLAVVLAVSEGDGAARLALGWRIAEDSRRAASTGVQLAPQSAPREAMIPLVGHPRWRGSVTQMALALEPGHPGPLTLTSASVVPANPVGGARLMLATWFGDRNALLAADGTAVRVLPLALWIAFVAVVSALLVALWWRRQPAARAQALRAVALGIAALALLLTVLGNRWPGWTQAILGSVALVAALLLAGAPLINRPLPIARWQALLGALLLFAGGAALSPMVAAVAAIPAIILTVAPVWPTWMTTGASLLAILPPLAIAAAAQRLIQLPAMFTPLVDPTSTLLTVANNASGLPGFALGLVALHRLWPAPARAARWATAPAAAAAWAVTGAVCVLAVPRLAVLANDSSAFIGLMLPALVCLALAMTPRFREVAASADDALDSGADKTEADLSANALLLLESHAERVRLNLERGEMGNARQALRQMTVMAPAARMTALATLRVALADDDLDAATPAAKRLQALGGLSTTEYDLLLEYAHRSAGHRQVIELAPHASATPGNARAVALAHLLDDSTDGRRAALQTLRQSPSADALARDIAEINLLLDDLPATQQALVLTGIPLDSPTGEAYIARLGLRAQGADAHADGVGKLAMWHPQLGAAHAALGEILLRQGNPVGARARLVLAMKLDPMLWPLQWYVKSIAPPTTADTESAPPAPAAMP